MFPGQGEDYVNMFLPQYEGESAFKKAFDACRDIVRRHKSLDIAEALYPARVFEKRSIGDFDSTALVHPLLFSVEYALAKMWMSWGLVPEAVLGHSLGEYAAATVCRDFLAGGRVVSRNPAWCVTGGNRSGTDVGCIRRARDSHGVVDRAAFLGCKQPVTRFQVVSGQRWK